MADPNERQFPMQNGPPIPWSLAEILYVGYSAQFENGQSLERLAERGGFGWGEIEEMWKNRACRLFRPAIESELKRLTGEKE